MIDFRDIPTYRVSELERLAIDFLKEHCWPAIQIPIDIDLLLEKEPNVAFGYGESLKENYGVAGTVVKKDGKYLVYIDADIADNNLNFYRFTVAEELAHLRLHRKILDQITDFDEAFELMEWSGYHKIDRNAKRFAAALLMPGPYLSEDARRLYPKLVKVAGFDDPDAIINYLISKLSKKYEVSPQTMKYRLNEWPIEIIEKVVAAMKERLPFLE